MTALRRGAAAAALVMATASVAGAQGGDFPGAFQAPRRLIGWGSITGQVGQPIGDFDQNVGTSGGLNVAFRLNADRRGVLGLRTDLGFLVYGNEKQRVRLSPTIPARVTADLNTSYSIFSLGIGPQLTVPVGFLRPYVAGGVGLAYFSTHSSLSGQDEAEQHFNTKNHGDWTGSLNGMAGLLVPLPSRHPVAIDLGVRYHGNGEAVYLPKGGITDNPDGSITLNRIRGEANFVTYHVGVSVGITPGAKRDR